MDTTGAYGGGKAGGAFDPQAFAQRPAVIVRAVCWVSSFRATLPSQQSLFLIRCATYSHLLQHLHYLHLRCPLHLYKFYMKY